MSHVCPSVPIGDDVRIYCNKVDDGYEVGVDTSAGPRLRTVFSGAKTKERAVGYAEWLTMILQHYCRVNSVQKDF